MNRQRSVHPAVSFSAYLLAIVVPLVLALAVVGSSPALLAMVPEEHRGTVASFGEGAARVSGGDGGLFRPAHADAANSTVPGTAVPLRGEWSPRRAADIQPPAGLIAGVDYAVEATEDGYLAHWPCEHEIPVRSYDAPPGSEPDLAWAVETLAFASGLPLRYAGPGAEGEREGDGAISVTYGDHPMFHTDPEIAGLGGVTVWPRGLVLQGSVTLRPDQINPVPGDAWTRSLTLHELMHAVGVDHAVAHGPEVMAERPGPHPPTILGYGDQFALRLVGCL
ncbi:MAG: hypothetical protein Q7T31_01635 [Dietzia sp.]|uniref:hypothetical protein n=1 Tax=unclassified Dietzia TaxID=2617939 RepID=UPI0015FC5E67|nr:hypothetical protein [Dietzia sp.]MBB1052255.1 hypothetical protein [Dietzia sp. CW19]MDO8393074.1 hypothetical protein [Dietzia sp.]